MLFAASTATREALAYCRTTTSESFVPTLDKPCDEVGLKVAWKSSCVGYFVQTGGSSVRGIDVSTARAVAKAAFDAWGTSLCPADVATCSAAKSDRHPSISATDLGIATCTSADYSQTSGNANMIFFRDTDWPHPDGDSTLALTTVSFDVDTGEIYDADIELNTLEHKITTDGRGPFDLQGILTHEAGHFFGLAHTQPANTDAVMSIGSEKRALALDDTCGICAIYDPARTATCDPAPRHGVAECARQPEVAKSTHGCHCKVGLSTGSDAGTGVVGALALVAGLLRRRASRCAQS